MSQEERRARMKAALDAAIEFRKSLKAGITIEDILADIREDRDR